MRRALLFLVMSLPSWGFFACSSQRSDNAPPSQHEEPAQPTTPGAVSPREEALNRFLWKFDGGDFEEFDGVGDASKTRYLRAFFDLTGDGKDEAIVSFRDSHRCGSGGCALLILTPTEDSYDEIGYVKLAQLPIRVLDRASHGWRNISFSLCGHGIPCPGDEQELKFNGEVYEEAPSSDSKVEGPSPGKALISGREPHEERTVFRPADSTAPSIASPPPEVTLRRALQDFLRDSYFIIVHLEGGNPAEFGYFSVFKDLNGDGMEEAVVYLTGPWRRTVILTPKGASYNVVGFQSLNPPLRVLATSSPNGWRQLSGWAAIGGGDMSLRETRLSFDGKRYVENKSGNDSTDPGPDSSGETIMEPVGQNQQGEPLFPVR